MGLLCLIFLPIILQIQIIMYGLKLVVNILEVIGGISNGAELILR